MRPVQSETSAKRPETALSTACSVQLALRHSSCTLARAMCSCKAPSGKCPANWAAAALFGASRPVFGHRPARKHLNIQCCAGCVRNAIRIMLYAVQKLNTVPAAAALDRPARLLRHERHPAAH